MVKKKSFSGSTQTQSFGSSGGSTAPLFEASTSVDFGSVVESTPSTSSAPTGNPFQQSNFGSSGGTTGLPNIDFGAIVERTPSNSTPTVTPTLSPTQIQVYPDPTASWWQIVTGTQPHLPANQSASNSMLQQFVDNKQGELRPNGNFSAFAGQEATVMDLYNKGMVSQDKIAESQKLANLENTTAVNPETVGGMKDYQKAMIWLTAIGMIWQEYSRREDRDYQEDLYQSRREDKWSDEKEQYLWYHGGVAPGAATSGGGGDDSSSSGAVRSGVRRL